MAVKEKAGLGCNGGSEIHPSHKTSFYALCISPLQGAKVSIAALSNAVAFVSMPDTAMNS